jgi:hypothetical protein
MMVFVVRQRSSSLSRALPISANHRKRGWDWLNFSGGFSFRNSAAKQTVWIKRRNNASSLHPQLPSLQLQPKTSLFVEATIYHKLRYRKEIPSATSIYHGRRPRPLRLRVRLIAWLRDQEQKRWTGSNNCARQALQCVCLDL